MVVDQLWHIRLVPVKATEHCLQIKSTLSNAHRFVPGCQTPDTNFPFCLKALGYSLGLLKSATARWIQSLKEEASLGWGRLECSFIPVRAAGRLLNGGLEVRPLWLLKNYEFETTPVDLVFTKRL